MRKHTYTREEAPTNTGSLSRPARFNLRRRHIIPIGTKIAALTVIGDAGTDDRHRSLSIVRCVCGKEFTVRTQLLTSKKQTACRGCAMKRKARRAYGRHVYIEPGTRFGSLVVLGPAERQGRHFCSRLLCDCGKTVIRQERLLPYIHTCGGKWHNPKYGKTSHDGKRERLYIIYKGMKQRCLNPKCKAYKNYGGRGIRICDEWKNDFLVFREWALSNGYSDKLSIDRIDVNGNYEPSNCRWATPREQASNKRPARRGYDAKGIAVECIETGKRYISASAASRDFGLSVGTIISSIRRGGVVGKRFHFRIITKEN